MYEKNEENLLRLVVFHPFTLAIAPYKVQGAFLFYASSFSGVPPADNPDLISLN
jgi:hypothetical protein